MRMAVWCSGTRKGDESIKEPGASRNRRERVVDARQYAVTC